MSDNKLIAFDFDGVLCNSTNECLITSYNAYHILINNKYDRVFSLNEIPDECKSLFTEYRSLAVIPKQFYIIWYAIINGEIESLYHPISNNLEVDQRTLDNYNKIFYLEREFWINNDINNWLKYTRFYPKISKLPKDFFCLIPT